MRVNGLFISKPLGNSSHERIKAIIGEFGVPYGATAWVSVKAIREFWNEYRQLIVHATLTPYKSVWGQLVKMEDSI